LFVVQAPMFQKEDNLHKEEEVVLVTILLQWMRSMMMTQVTIQTQATIHTLMINNLGFTRMLRENDIWKMNKCKQDNIIVRIIRLFNV